MIDLADLELIAKARLEDARVLLSQGRYDGAEYLCGYAIEIALKFRAATTLNWADFPETPGEFREFQSFRSHNLVTLLRLSGYERLINANHLAVWSAVRHWNPESRYNRPGNVTQAAAKSMIDNAERIVDLLL